MLQTRHAPRTVRRCGQLAMERLKAGRAQRPIQHGHWRVIAPQLPVHMVGGQQLRPCCQAACLKALHGCRHLCTGA